MDETTTKFIGDIQFKVGDATRKGSELLTLSDLDGYVQGGSWFEEVEGYPEYEIKNENITAYKDESLSMANYNILKINMSNDVLNKIIAAPDVTVVFKFILRKEVIYDYEGNLVKEFTAYVENHQAKGPCITCRTDLKCMVTHWTTFGPEFFIAFDTRLGVNPYSLYMNGELSIQYLLKQDSMVAKKPVVKCDVIDARNALQLYESDVHYFYKPSVVTTVNVDSVDYYKMIYRIPNDYTIPINLNFTFTEHCFGNRWSLIWDGTKWVGENMQGRSNGKIESSKQYLRVNKNNYGASGCYVRCKRSEWNKMLLDDTNENFMKVMFANGTTKLLFKDGTEANGSAHSIEIDRCDSTVEIYTKEGYDYLPLQLQIQNSNKEEVESLLNRIDKIVYDMSLDGASNRLTFRWDELHKNEHYGYDIDLIAELDSIEKINYYWSSSYINIATRDI